MAWKLPKAEARSIAQQFSLAPDGSEDTTFDLGWKLKSYASDFAKDNVDETQEQVGRGFDDFAAAVRGERMSGRLGHAELTRLPVKGRYVVFSDHHITHTGNRQNFMQTSGNLDLYRDVLEEYLDADFTLIEAGDVEDLVIFDPSEAELRQRLAILDDGNGDVASWDTLDRRRLERRLAELRLIVNDSGNAEYYAMLRKFCDGGRLVRVTGNHDYNLQREEFLAVLRRKLPGRAIPSDYVFLTDDTAALGEDVRFAILHGHQFDTSCLPTYAPKLGELFSESLAWSYQGGDRTWKWRGDGASGRDWVEGKGFNNNLVTDDPGSVWGGTAGAAIGAFMGNLHSKDAWEQLFGHLIAWEYFQNTDPQKAVEEEVRTGEAFFKYRHLNEEFIRRRLMDDFPDASVRPKLLLGHTHEVRHRSAYRGDDITGTYPSFQHYLNCGAAGRFENLLWAVEIVDGVESVISWSRRAVNAGGPERRVYTPIEIPMIGSVLHASNAPLELPRPVTARETVWLSPVLHAMMSGA